MLSEHQEHKATSSCTVTMRSETTFVLQTMVAFANAKVAVVGLPSLCVGAVRSRCMRNAPVLCFRLLTHTVFFVRNVSMSHGFKELLFR